MKRKMLRLAAVLGLVASVALSFYALSGHDGTDPAPRSVAVSDTEWAAPRGDLDRYLRTMEDLGFRLDQVLYEGTRKVVTGPFDIYSPLYQGFSRREAVYFGSFDGVEMYAVLVLSSGSPGNDTLKVLRVRDGQSGEVFSYTVPPRTLASCCAYIQVDADLTFRDINGDGRRDLVLQEGLGTNAWIDNGVHAFTYYDGRFLDIPVVLPHSTGGPTGDLLGATRVEDIDGDGAVEVLAIDASWELASPFCHACSPGVFFVLAWNGAAYVDASGHFRPFYEGQMDESVRAAREYFVRNPDNSYGLGAAASVVLNASLIGEAGRGWAVFDDLVGGVASPEFRRQLAAFLPVLEAAIPRP